MATLAKLALTCCGLVMLGILPDDAGRTALAQSSAEPPKAVAQDRPTFEVASVRPAPPHTGPFPMNQMLQSLLAERFKLRVRWETRSFQVLPCGAQQPSS
jgi:hypothetical protein